MVVCVSMIPKRFDDPFHFHIGGATQPQTIFVYLVLLLFRSNNKSHARNPRILLERELVDLFWFLLARRDTRR